MPKAKAITNNYRLTTDKKPKIMAPAGDWTMLTTAVKSGADEVYFGVDKLNMRAKAKNFTVDDLTEIAKFCKENNVETFLTLNSIVYEDELSELEEIIINAKDSGIDRIICWDFGVIELCKKHDIPFCISTQASISNSASAKFFKDLGATRVVLARECSLKQIKEIKEKVDIEIETFVHGAMCIAVSGRCFMSHHLFGKSANRGECIQPCRREYEVYDPTIKKSMILGEDYIMSPKDLCSIEYIDKLIESGIDSFKIEGRKRSPEYVSTTISTYKNAVDLYFKKELSDKIKKEMLNELEEVYNRGFSSGFYFDKPSSEEYADIYGSKATTRKQYIGKVVNYYRKINVVHILIETGELKAGDEIYFIGPKTGTVKYKVKELVKDNEKISTAKKGDEITFPAKLEIRSRDSVYVKRYKET